MIEHPSPDRLAPFREAEGQVPSVCRLSVSSTSPFGRHMGREGVATPGKTRRQQEDEKERERVRPEGGSMEVSSDVSCATRILHAGRDQNLEKEDEE